MKLNERLKKIRIELKLNQQQLADQLGVTQAAISATEKGKNNLTSETLYILLTKYNINLNYLIAGIGTMFIKEEVIDEDNLLVGFNAAMEKRMSEVEQKLFQLKEDIQSTTHDKS